MTSLPNSHELLSALSSGAAVVRDGHLFHVNPALNALTGSVAHVQGLPIEDLLSISPPVHCALCQGKGHDFATPHAALLTTASGEQLRVKVKHSALPDGSVLCLIDPFSEDTTLTQAHSDFVSTVSHEFRTPLTSIKGFADTMLKYGSQLPEEQQRRFIHIIKEQADRMIRLTENLLTVSRAGGGQRSDMSFRPVNLPRLLEQVVQSIQARLGPENARQFVLKLHPALPEVWADADRLEQVLINLIDNAAKYSKIGSEVDIAAFTHPEDAAKVRIQVRDRGIGIPPAYLPRLFTQFYRIDNPLTRQVEGTGLGLYIVKSLTASMDGEIMVTSMPEPEPDHGTTFTLDFPAATAERQAIHRRRLYAEQDAPHEVDLAGESASAGVVDE